MMSWKYKIGLLYGGFVVMILMMVAMTYWYTGKVQLVDENYYQKELRYQKTIDARNRGARYQYAFQIKQTSSELLIEYPEHLQGEYVTVQGYCISDASKDFGALLQMPIEKKLLRKGPYKITIHWGQEPLDTLVELSAFIE
jgi:hypothetical protein